MANRRDFLQTLALLTSGVMLPWQGKASAEDSIGEILPLRKLGNTGEEVTMLGLGGFHVGWTTLRDAQEVVETAVELGIRFFDTAYSYGKGASELRYGEYLVPKYREQVFIMTKSTAISYATARQELEESLRRMKCDYVDLWQIHSLRSPKDVDGRIQNGVLKLAEEALKEGKAKYIGFTGHQNPYAHLRMLEQAGKSGLFSTVQMPINVVDAGSYDSFIQKVIPQALNYNLGVLAMKTLADGRFFEQKHMKERQVWKTDNPVIPNYMSVEEALRFAWSLPISVLITGAETADLVREKVTFAKRLVNMSEEERLALIAKMAKHVDGKRVEYYKKIT
ncbi:aldo/keto reductase [Puteibacter caeruleilacunae]|nr:aldo/keto reductase [Puteibacter caeruleilacunae]